MLLTQPQIILKLRHEGYKDVSTRTLTFWRSEGFLPKLTRNGRNEGCYREEVLDSIRLLAQRSRRKESRDESVVFLKTGDQEWFDIIKIEIVRLTTGLKILYHIRGSGVLVREMREEEIPYAFT